MIEWGKDCLTRTSKMKVEVRVGDKSSTLSCYNRKVERATTRENYLLRNLTSMT
jgi:hypothetical protein